jgi:hypothetical protein
MANNNDNDNNDNMANSIMIYMAGSYTVRTQKYGFFFLPKTELKKPFRKTSSVFMSVPSLSWAIIMSVPRQSWPVVGFPSNFYLTAQRIMRRVLSACL